MSGARWLPRFRKAYESLPALAERETWSRTRIERYQLERLNELWAHARQYVPYYRHLAECHNLPAAFQDLDEFRTRMPLLSKAVVRTGRYSFLSERSGPGAWRYTGGSTGDPTPVFRSHKTHHAMLRSRYRFYQMWGVDIFDRWAYLWGHRLSFPPGIAGWTSRLRIPIEDWFRNRIRLSAYELGPDDLRRHLDRIAAFQPGAIYTYSTAGYLLALAAEESGFRCDSLKIVSLTSEPVFPNIVETVERCFGVPAVNEYGSIECGFLAGEWPDRTLRVREDEVLLETIPRKDEYFDLIVTVLGNSSFPLIRYAIGDVTDCLLACPPTGFAILRNVSGRNHDLIVTRSGRKIHGIFCEEIMEQHASIRRYQVHQRKDASLAIQIESVEPIKPAILQAVKKQFQEMTEGLEVTVKRVDELPVTPSGKHRPVVSELAVL